MTRATLIGSEGFDGSTASPLLGNKVSRLNSRVLQSHRVCPFLPSISLMNTNILEQSVDYEWIHVRPSCSECSMGFFAIADPQSPPEGRSDTMGALLYRSQSRRRVVYSPLIKLAECPRASGKRGYTPLLDDVLIVCLTLARYLKSFVPYVFPHRCQASWRVTRAPVGSMAATHVG